MGGWVGTWVLEGRPGVWEVLFLDPVFGFTSHSTLSVCVLPTSDGRSGHVKKFMGQYSYQNRRNITHQVLYLYIYTKYYILLNGDTGKIKIKKEKSFSGLRHNIFLKNKRFVYRWLPLPPPNLYRSVHLWTSI